jgi:23S rRNA (adenine1618-N6)-methyltransferase
LVSKKDNLEPLTRVLENAKVADYKIIEMVQGQKVSRFLAWSFVKENERSLFLKEAGG